MANAVEVVTANGETLQLDPEVNFFDHEKFGMDYEMSDDEKKALLRNSRLILHKYGYNTEALDKVLFGDDRWLSNKGWMINLFKNHPDYVDGKYYIAQQREITRKITKSGIRKFKEWCIAHTNETNVVQKLRAEITTNELNELRRKADRLENLVSNIRELQSTVESRRGCIPDIGDDDIEIVINGKPYSYFRDLKREAKSEYEKYEVLDGEVYLTGAFTVKETLCRLFSLLASIDDQFVTEGFADTFNSNAQSLNLKTEAKAGQKYSKLYSKLCIEIGLSTIKEIKNYTYHDQNGVEHSKEKDYGFNYQFYSLFADSINPVTFTRHMVISVNPIDFWTMSFGTTWASCQTIDVDKLRQEQGGMGSNYGGMYSAGTESLMLDESTFVVYYVDAKTEKDFENEDKFKRCLFWLGENKLIQSRVYPDGRDGVTEDEDCTSNQIAKDIREMVEQVISECANVPNSWVYKGGTGTANSSIDTDDAGSHYKDYRSYEDVGTAFLKVGERLYKNTTKIRVGHAAVCPSCGKVHNRDNNIQCDSCQTRDNKTGHQIVKGLAYKYHLPYGDVKYFVSQEDRDEFIRDRANDNNWSDEKLENELNVAHEADALEAKERSEELFPTALPKTETETENANAETSNETAA